MMARRKTTPRKPPEGPVKKQDTPQDNQELLLADYIEVRDRLDRLLKAEARQYVSSIGRRQLHQIADSIRKQIAELEGKKEDSNG